MTPLKKSGLLRHSTIIFIGIILLCVQFMEMPRSSAQTRKRRRATASVKKAPTVREALKPDMVERAITTICQERIRDPQGSIPIDVMASQPPLPLDDPRVVEGRRRAERLLPVAKRLVPIALSRLAASYDLEPLSLNWIVSRANTVGTINAEVEAHDNAAWRPNEPRAITFGTIFLAGLRSDEAMITVLAHELTHAVNGTDQALQPLLSRIGAKASQMRGSPVEGEIAVELASEMVGIQVLREYTGRSSKGGVMRRHLARALGKDCVRLDLADAHHLSPRETMRILLRLDPTLTSALAGGGDGKKRPRKRRG
jgi:hypothetical protein